MLKKSSFVAIALLAVGLAVVQAQDMATIEAIAREAEQVTNDFQAGKITMPEYQRRMQELQERTLRAYQPDIERGQRQLQQQPRQQQTHQQPQQTQQGANAGWPPASAFQGRFKISPLTQPAGTTASYDSSVDKGVVNSLSIYLTGGNVDTVLQNLKQQINKATGKQMTQEKGYEDYFLFINDPSVKVDSHLGASIRFWLRKEDNVVVLTISPVVG